MFEHLTDLSFQRSRKQAIGFYLAVLLAGGIVTAIVVNLYMRATGMHIPARGDFADAISMVKELRPITIPVIFVISTVLAALIAWAKKLYNGTSVICIGLAAILSIGGAVLSFIPVAYLTTLPKRI